MAYLTVLEYVARYGERETGLLTNETAQIGGSNDPAYDAPKVESAIVDATEEIEGYIARRYSVPLASPPRIVKGWVGAITRLKLAEGTGRVGEAIKDAADRAYAQLAQLVAAKFNLPVDEDAPPLEAVGSGSPMTSGDRATPVFTNCGLDDFTAPFTGGDRSPRWMR